MKLQMKDFDSVRNETIAFDENENQKIVATYSVKDGNMWFAYFSPKTIKGMIPTLELALKLWNEEVSYD